MNKSPNPVDQYLGKRIRMRRLMLDMSQTNLAVGLGLTFQQVQKYENGKNRSARAGSSAFPRSCGSRCRFFFDGGPAGKGQRDGLNGAPSPAYVSDFLATSDGPALVKAFARIMDPRLRRAIVTMVKQLASEDD